MAKRLVIKTGTYIKDGQEKGEYLRLGVMMDGDNGPYLLLDPCVNLAGCLIKQNMMNHKGGKQVRDSLMVSVFEDENQQQRPQQSSQNQHSRQGQQQAPQQQSQQAPDSFDYDPSIPF